MNVLNCKFLQIKKTLALRCTSMYNRSKLVVKFDLTNANMMAELNVLSSFLSGTTYYLVQTVDSAIQWINTCKYQLH